MTNINITQRKIICAISGQPCGHKDNNCDTCPTRKGFHRDNIMMDEDLQYDIDHHCL